MVAIYHFFENISVHMGIDLSGGNIRMAQHLLHNTKVRASLKQVRSKGMPKLMRREVTLDTSDQRGAPHDIVEGHARDGLTLLTDKDEIAVLTLQKLRACVF